MYCPNCGSEIKDDSVFCSQCGAKQSDYIIDHTEQKNTTVTETSTENISSETTHINDFFEPDISDINVLVKRGLISL